MLSADPQAQAAHPESAPAAQPPAAAPSAHAAEAGTGEHAAPTAADPSLSASAVTEMSEVDRSREAPVVAAPARDEGHDDASNDAAAEPAPSRFNRFALLAASLTLVAGLGAAAGGAGTAAVTKFAAAPQAAKAAGVSRAELNDELKGLRDSVAQLRTALRTVSDNVGSLRGQVDAKASAAQFARINEALERIEKAQTEPAARLAKATEALERVEKRAATPPVDVTGSIGTPKPRNLAVPHSAEPASLRMPVVEGWNLRRVINGVAIIEGRMGVIEAEVGDTVPGLGRIEEMKRQDGRWVLVTNRGVVQSR